VIQTVRRATGCEGVEIWEVRTEGGRERRGRVRVINSRKQRWPRPGHLTARAPLPLEPLPCTDGSDPSSLRDFQISPLRRAGPENRAWAHLRNGSRARPDHRRPPSQTTPPVFCLAGPRLSSQGERVFLLFPSLTGRSGIFLTPLCRCNVSLKLCRGRRSGGSRKSGWPTLGGDSTAA
jgi:hypothetical protein